VAHSRRHDESSHDWSSHRLYGDFRVVSRKRSAKSFHFSDKALTFIRWDEKAGLHRRSIWERRFDRLGDLLAEPDEN